MWRVTTAIYVLGCGGVQAWLRLSNPDMTNTRLFMTYWWLWALMVGVAIPLLTLVNWEVEKEQDGRD